MILSLNDNTRMTILISNVLESLSFVTVARSLFDAINPHMNYVAPEKLKSVSVVKNLSQSRNLKNIKIAAKCILKYAIYATP